ncbi:hypothetical protein [Halobacterium wangiae]|uniref:hypothetical protein n=1 Tax=Halobacterium wangiae TaxID=2902623 RepID=UPI001E38E0DB|nr:hypothetical protein [Halobacterium wangiae]
MRSKPVVLSVVAGVAAFVAVGAATTELVAPWIEFSLFVGLPAGVVAGALAASVVYLGFADGAPAKRRRVALAVAGFGVVFLGVLVLAAAVFGLGVVAALGLGAVLGLATAAGYYREVTVTPQTAAD